MMGIWRSAALALIRRRHLISVNAGKLDVHKDQIRHLRLRQRQTFLARHRLDQLIAEARQEIA